MSVVRSHPPLPKEMEMETKIYLTEYEKDGKLYGYRVEAYSWWHAELVLLQQGRDEEVVGELIEEIILN